MTPPHRATESARIASLTVIHPSGSRTRTPLHIFPFLIGRQAGNHLVLRDNRTSRSHARIVREGPDYFVEDLNSRLGIYVNGERVQRHRLTSSDRIDFGLTDCYQLIFALEEDEIQRILSHLPTGAPTSQAAGANLAKLRAVVDVARALQSSLSTEDVLAAVVDAALAVTGTERGFLLLRNGDALEVSVARDHLGATLGPADLKVPTSIIHRALRNRRELLSMSFDPAEQEGIRPEMSVADLELRGVVCVPLILVRAGSSQDTVAATVDDSVGLLYLDSRRRAADLSAGNRELLQTLALEASTILENARLLEQERAMHRMEEELGIARQIQQGLLPDRLPTEGWFRAAGSSVASHQVGGDYFDVRRCAPDTWCAMVADVSGKGVSSALLASLLQGAFLFASEGTVQIDRVMTRINHFLIDRAKGEKYATAFYCTVDRNGLMRWANAGHPKPLLIRAGDGSVIPLHTTGMPLGMLEIATYGVDEIVLEPGDKVVMFSDGVSEAENAARQMFEKHFLENTIRANAGNGAAGLHDALREAFDAFMDGEVAGDDLTWLVLEYQRVC